jgi:hypothetical protein
MKHALALILFLSWVAPLGAADTPSTGDGLIPAASRIEATQPQCPAPDKLGLLSQVSQSDCCKGHKGVCGCRAGKIVCCDNTTSAACTCHADSGVEN